ncbi:MAG: OmpA family protein [Nitrospiria bacterium]
MKVSGKIIMGIVLIGLILGAADASNAAEIVMQDYRYATDMPVLFSSGEMFVICDCPEPSAPALQPVMPPLALKMSLPESTPDRRGAAQDAGELRYTITFDFDSDGISSSGKEKVKSVIERIKAVGGETHIQIIGYTCDIGPAAYNQDLSTRRAESVAALFRSDNLHPEDVKGKGSCCPVSKTRALNRRVEIIVQQGGPS